MAISRLLVVPLLLAGSCVIAESDSEPASSWTGNIEQDFNVNVAPLFAQDCNACHVPTTNGGGVLQLDYQTIISTPALNGGNDPTSSRLITLNDAEHEGPAFTNNAYDEIVLRWLEEAQAAGY